MKFETEDNKVNELKSMFSEQVNKTDPDSNVTKFTLQKTVAL